MGAGDWWGRRGWQQKGTRSVSGDGSGPYLLIMKVVVQLSVFVRI